jgi:hypothetical protein
MKLEKIMDQNQGKKDFPTAVEFFIEIPLYEEIPIAVDDVDKLTELHNFFLIDRTFDSYCIDCQKPSVFSGVKPTGGFRYWNNESVIIDHLTSFRIACSRNKDHQYVCFVMISGMKMIKVGQYPSLADVAKADIQKYRKVLPTETFGEFSRGIGLVAHGIGIGSVVYLRRTFEKLIHEAYDKAKTEAGWNEEQYIRSRMDEKIVLLKKHLPSFLVETKSIYSILSVEDHDKPPL